MFSPPLACFYHAIQVGNFGPLKPQVVREDVFSSFLYEAFLILICFVFVPLVSVPVLLELLILCFFFYHSDLIAKAYGRRQQ